MVNPKTWIAVIYILLPVNIWANTLSEPDKPNYFKDENSVTYQNRSSVSDNQIDAAPVVIVRNFDISALPIQNEYGIASEDIEGIIQSHLKKFKNRFTVERLDTVALAVSRYYQSKGLILAKVYFPKQRIKNQTLKLDVILGTIESIEPEKNESYKDHQLTDPFSHLIGKPAYLPDIDSFITQVNNYPGIEVDSYLAKGNETGSASLRVRTNKETRKDLSYSMDNYGSEFTGLYRATLAASFYNLTGLHDQLDLNLLATIDPSNAYYGGIRYSSKFVPTLEQTPNWYTPLYRHGLDTSIAYQTSSFTVGEEFEKLNIKGQVKTAELKVKKDWLLNQNRYLNTAIIFQRKTAETVGNGNIEVKDEIAEVGFQSQFSWKDNLLSPSSSLINITYHQGLTGVAGSHTNDTEQRISRISGLGEKAPFDYSKLTAQFSRMHRVDEFGVFTGIELQHTDDLMLSSEQVNLGGPTNVRGYTPSDFSADKSAIVTLELSTKPNAKTYSLPISDLKLAGFVDMGVGERLSPFLNETKVARLASIGGYAQFLKQGSFSSKIELAIPLLPSPATDQKDDFAILFSFSKGL